MKRLFLALAFFLPICLSAQEVAVGLSAHQAQVGEPIQLMVTVRGARGAEIPQKLQVNGLQINLAGRSTQFEMRNFKMSSTLTYTYLVVPQIEGEFTIPSFEVKVEDKVFRTQAMKLAVSADPRAHPAPGYPQSSVPMPSDQPPVPSGEGEPFFADLILSKKKVFVGEVVPVELRFYFNSRIGGQVGERPTFGGEGFTVQKFSNAVKREQVVNGASYVVFSFQSAITAVKPGPLEIPEASLDARLQLPGQMPQGFDNFFGNLPIPQGMFTNNRDVTLKTKPAQMEVLPLPKEGRPEDFSGAVGKFTMEASVSPKKTAAGEPVTLRVVVAGQGNFEGMGAPVLTGEEGWRTYPPSDKFQSTDAVGFTGEKVFEFPLIARQDQTRTPGVRFSFFDPASEKFVVLTQDPLGVQAKAGGGAPSTPVPATAPAPGDTQPSSATPASTPDIAVMAGGAASWTALIVRREFLIANAALAVAWLAIALILIVRRFTRSRAGLEMARRKHLKDSFAALKKVEPGEFYEKARDHLVLRVSGGKDDLAALAGIEASRLSPELKHALLQILERHGESKYAAGGTPPPSVEERRAIMTTLKQLEASYEK